ncbi:DNA polymerase III subunit delta' [Actinomycetospora endophytica]|uniref:DNA polymerase III subunit delta n=1 Tax=Actinomycetospora endophytica TaxID=2291215 RepID=A0ABS8P5N8_9PSEU|nr:DNA polymerase III subunit delta' [Actinomycetospora endophytica]MCD2193572.1 DNA polymerase III subunit delta' [Actinomycetospora endophytica]
MSVWSQVVGQPEAVAELRAAAEHAAHVRFSSDGEGEEGARGGAMTHAWLFTGPPGSGRSVAARAFAAALQCPRQGCDACQVCRTVAAGTHADVHEVATEGLSLGVKEMRGMIERAARMPTTARWQIILIEDADRMTEQASNAVLKAVEEPNERTVFLLCAPSEHPDDVSVTIRSRCRPLRLRTPVMSAIAEVLAERDGIDAETASWAASVCGGHIGRARRLARDDDARNRREAVLAVPRSLRSAAEVFAAADGLVGAAEAEVTALTGERDEAEREELAVSMGAGGSGKGVAQAQRAAKAAEKDLEKQQRLRATRTRRDALDRALVDLAGYYRDVLVRGFGAEVTATHPDRAREVESAARDDSRESALRRLEAILACREALETNVKPQIAVEAMVTALRAG